MSKTRNLSDLLDANGDVKSTALDNVPASNDASALTTGTLDNARLATNVSVSGDLTVDTNTLKVDATNNRVGIGTTSPQEDLSIESNSFPKIEIANNDGSNPTNGVALDLLERQSAGASFGETGAFGFRLFLEGATNRFDIISGNQATVDTRFSLERNTGNIGIGTTSPSSKLDVNGTVTASGVSVGDNENIYLGASNDLNIYHDGVSTSYIKASSDLVMQGTDDIVIRDASTQEEHIRCNHNDSVQISYDGSVKLATTSSGITVTGTVSATNSIGMWVDFNAGNDSIYDDYNVSSITNRTTGRNTVNYSSNLTNNNYAIAGMARVTSNDGGGCTVSLTSGMHITYVKTNGQCTVDTITTDNSSNDAVNVCVMAVRA